MWDFETASNTSALSSFDAGNESCFGLSESGNSLNDSRQRLPTPDTWWRTPVQNLSDMFSQNPAAMEHSKGSDWIAKDKTEGMKGLTQSLSQLQSKLESQLQPQSQLPSQLPPSLKPIEVTNTRHKHENTCTRTTTTLNAYSHCLLFVVQPVNVTTEP